MPKLIVATRAGDELTIDARPGRSVMELMRDYGVPDLLALCGGSRSCATCHVWVDAEFAGRFPAPVEDEDELLDSSSHRKPTSRLSCQLQWSDDLDGLRVTLAPDG
ncbi:2Fe-2S iron-sulfur cluster-binding protein [Povalibacter sp.]|uniref:2Fe-2S iron-sulfur cluster-binding protein n=1 Tax=Povalibacter sp. TaxID=1962978 RepID=UPI002F426982